MDPTDADARMSAAVRVLVCGGRVFGNIEDTGLGTPEYWTACDQWDFGLAWLQSKFKDQSVVVISGNAKGADEIGEDFAVMEDHELEVYKADWKTHGKKAGALRNIQMLEKGKPDLVVAFPGGRGTAHMVQIARAAGVEVIEVVYVQDN